MRPLVYLTSKYSQNATNKNVGHLGNNVLGVRQGINLY